MPGILTRLSAAAARTPFFRMRKAGAITLPVVPLVVLLLAPPLAAPCDTDMSGPGQIAQDSPRAAGPTARWHP